MVRFRLSMRSSGMSAVLACAVLAACSDTPDEPSSNARGSWGARELPVVTAPVERAPLIDSIKSVGTARASQSVTLYPESSGVVMLTIIFTNIMVQEYIMKMNPIY